VSLIFGDAAFDGERSVAVSLRDGGTRRLTSDRIFINTGTRSAVPAVAGLDSVPRFDNGSIMEIEELPAHLLVLGGGYIGLEFGHIFRALKEGIFAHPTLAESLNNLLLAMDG
jgi:pyruvate/2-oxoglutarate dehydrogenase complex dihydrolipoamide dehydrogenase (E3) component